jgi:pimeloyl-ACP methyl ester carboxylesterase
MNNMPNFKELLPLIQLACEGAYELDVSKCHDLVVSYGMEFVKVIGNGECFITVVRRNGDLVLGVRGTQFTDGFSLAQLLDNERFEEVTAQGVPGFAMDGYAAPLWSLLDAAVIPWTPRTYIVGHSMGGIRTLLAAARVPDNVKLTRIALAPPCGMDKDFSATLNARYGESIVIGRECDFALNHPILAPKFIQQTPILHLTSNAPEYVEKWPWWDESIEDHKPEKYLEDWVKLAQL